MKTQINVTVILKISLSSKPCQNYKLRNKLRLKLNITHVNEKDKKIFIRYSLRFNKQLTYKKGI